MDTKEQILTPEQADYLLENNDWAKWSDARFLLQVAAGMGEKNTASDIAQWLESQGHADLASIVRKRWT